VASPKLDPSPKPIEPIDPTAERGWKRSRVAPSLQDVYRSVPVGTGGFFRKLLAFAGPGYLVAVGYMDPGNWATDLAGGSRFGYTLLSVILLSNLIAVLLQGLSSKLGIVTGRDLAQACRDHYPRYVNIALWLLCEIAIAACDLAEVIGSAIALNLLFHMPIAIGVLVTGFDVLILLSLQNRGVRVLEALVITLIATVGLCFLFEIILSHPDFTAVAKGFIPTTSIITDHEMLYVAIGILGATVMPNNLYLHSSIVQTRRYEETAAGTMAVRRVIKRRSQGRTRMLRNPSITICPASVPVSVEFCPEASSARANAVLAPAPSSGVSSLYAS
jgi:manganese transport protein